jgi:hypothetical protein
MIKESNPEINNKELVKIAYIEIIKRDFDIYIPS